MSTIFGGKASRIKRELRQEKRGYEKKEINETVDRKLKLLERLPLTIKESKVSYHTKAYPSRDLPQAKLGGCNASCSLDSWHSPLILYFPARTSLFRLER